MVFLIGVSVMKVHFFPLCFSMFAAMSDQILLCALLRESSNCVQEHCQ